MIDHYDHITAWASWALEAIDTWDDTTTPARTWAAPAHHISPTPPIPETTPVADATPPPQSGHPSAARSAEPLVVTIGTRREPGEPASHASPPPSDRPDAEARRRSHSVMNHSAPGRTPARRLRAGSMHMLGPAWAPRSGYSCRAAPGVAVRHRGESWTLSISKCGWAPGSSRARRPGCSLRPHSLLGRGGLFPVPGTAFGVHRSTPP